MAIPTFSPQALEALAALLSALQAATPATPAPAPRPAQGMPRQMADFWASDYPGKGIAVRQIRNGKWVDVKGAFCKPLAVEIKTPAAPTLTAYEADVARGLEQLETAETIAALYHAGRITYAMAFGATATRTSPGYGIAHQLGRKAAARMLAA